MSHKKKILFVTTSNLATNPRLVKEMDLAIQQGYCVAVICFSFGNWSAELNNQIKERFGTSIDLTEIPAGSTPVLPWLLSAFFQQLAKFFYLFAGNRLSFISFSLMKRTWLLQQELNKRRAPVDLIVAHNPGSFYPAFTYSKKTKTPFGIDVEDYHPGETNDPGRSMMIRKMMQEILPAAVYVTGASPLILEKVKEDCDGKLFCTETVLNYFHSSEFLPPGSVNSSKLKMVWFSQIVSTDRGLEEILPIVDELHEQIELTIIGNLTPAFERRFLAGKRGVVIQKPLPQEKLHQFLSETDVGLALEPGRDLNNRYAISNKLLAYLQGGLFLLVSDTIAQKEFIKQYPDHGIVTSLNYQDLKNIFQTLINNRTQIRQSAVARFEKASDFNCETELKKLAAIWDTMI